MSLAGAVDEVLRAGLPGLFGGTTPAVTLTVERAGLTVEAVPAGAGETEPQRGDGFDLLPFDGEGPYTPSQLPADGPRQVWLQGELGRTVLRDDEIRWDSRTFTLVLDGRDLAGVTAVGVRYSVILVRTRVQLSQTIHIGLSGAGLERAEALVLAVLVLEQRQVTAASRDEFLDGDYGATVVTESLTIDGAAVRDDSRQLQVRVRRELIAGRALRTDEGQPIVRIHGPGRPPRPGHPVDIPVDV
jgi:hypothetical protein